MRITHNLVTIFVFGEDNITYPHQKILPREALSGGAAARGRLSAGTDGKAKRSMFQRIRAALAAFDAGKIQSEHALALRLAMIEYGFTGRPAHLVEECS